MPFTPENTVLVVIDVQGKLAHLVQEKEQVFNSIRGLIQAAYHLDIPFLYTEQVPAKIGETIPEIKEMLFGHNPIVKEAFSCCMEKDFMNKIKSLNRKNIIICGIEAHVCVYQTVIDLLDDNYPVQVVYDAVSSRSIHDKEFAIERMHSAGADITTTEMLVCELIKTSRHPKFKEVLNLLKS